VFNTGPRRSVAGRPRPPRLQASPDRRRRRHPPGGHADRRQPQRRHPAHPAGRRRVTDPQGRLRRRSWKLFADRGYDHDIYRRQLRARGITPRIARRGIETSDKLGRYRWVIERSLAWLTGYYRLTLCYERSSRLFTAFLTLAATLTCYKKLAT
jgi:hypothetical protein